VRRNPSPFQFTFRAQAGGNEVLRRAFSSKHSIVGLGTLGLTRCAVLLSVIFGSMDAGAQPVLKSTPRSCPNLEFRFLKVGDTIVAPEGFTQLFFYDAN
jgi:hypothetical protein